MYLKNKKGAGKRGRIMFNGATDELEEFVCSSESAVDLKFGNLMAVLFLSNLFSLSFQSR